MADLGHKETDEIIDAMTGKVDDVYRTAVADVQAKLDDYLQRLDVKDRTKRLQLARGEITQAEYNKWRTGQIMIGQRWEEMRDTLALDLHHANEIARSVVNGYMPEVYALNHDYATFTVEKAGHVDTSYTLYDRPTAERLLREEQILPEAGPSMKKRIAAGKDIAWQEGKIQSVMLQGILQGESIPNLSKRIAREMGESNHASTIRYARTASTASQNAGRLDAYKRAEDMGIEMKQTWVATLDGRTRHEHRILDGQTVPVGEPFEVDGYKIRYPGDPTAEGFLIWNCRCTTIAQLKGFERDVTYLGLRNDNKIDGMSYDEWKEARSVYEPITRQEETSEAMRNRTIMEDYRGGGLGTTSTTPKTHLTYAFDGVDEQVAEVYKGIAERMSAEYPLKNDDLHVTDFRTAWGFQRDVDLVDFTDAHVEWEGVGAIFYPDQTRYPNATALTIKGPHIVMYDAEEASLMSFEDGLKALADIREQTGWHGKENSFFNAAIGAEGMFVHEYGHALANDCGLYFGQEHYEKLKAIFDGHTAEEISRDISIYATTNPEEMFAEAFVLSFEPRLRNPLIDEIMGLFNGLWG